MKRKIVLMTAYEAFKNKGSDLTPCESLDSLFLELFEDFEQTLDGVDSFHDFLRYECHIAEEIEQNCELIAKSGNYKLLRAL